MRKTILLVLAGSLMLSAQQKQPSGYVANVEVSDFLHWKNLLSVQTPQFIANDAKLKPPFDYSNVYGREASWEFHIDGKDYRLTGAELAQFVKDAKDPNTKVLRVVGKSVSALLEQVRMCGMIDGVHKTLVQNGRADLADRANRLREEAQCADVDRILAVAKESVQP